MMIPNLIRKKRCLSLGCSKELEKSAWIVDSGASWHMTFEMSWFVNYIAFRTPQKVRTANGDSIQALGYGDIVIQTILDIGTDMFTVKDVLLVPDLTCSLLSVSALLEKIWKFNSVKESLKFWIKREKYVVKRLGHVNELQLRETIKKGQICNVKISDNDLLKFCDGYVEAKMSRKPNKPVGEIQSEYPGQLVHSDLCGPMSESIGGSKYFVTYIDDFSRWVKISFLREKKEAMVKFKEFEAEVWNQ
ncbi:hypothetical protein EMCRGX_G017744 [Ephydatia muelleri]